MTDSENTFNPTLNRRKFLKGAVLFTLGAYAITNQSPPSVDTKTTVPPTYRHEIAGQDLYFSRMTNSPQEALTTKEGLVFDLVSQQFLQPREGQHETLLLGSAPAFDRWRDSQITPALIQSSVTLSHIVHAATANLDMWGKVLREKVEAFGKIPQDFIAQNPEYRIPKDTPNPLLRAQTVASALASRLVYDRMSPETFADLSLQKRIDLGYTNCFEFSLISTAALAQQGLPSEILYFQFKSPGGKESAHVMNILNLQGTCVAMDISTHGKDMKPLSTYLRSYFDAGFILNKGTQTTSIIAQESYPLFPWHDSSWINNTDISFSIPNMLNTQL